MANKKHIKKCEVCDEPAIIAIRDMTSRKNLLTGMIEKNGIKSLESPKIENVEK
jgi:hypothetical protein